MTPLTYVLMKSYFISIKDSLYTYELKYFPQIKLQLQLLSIQKEFFSLPHTIVLLFQDDRE